MALLVFTRQKGTKIHNYVLLAVFVVVHSYFTFVQPNLAYRVLNISMALVIVWFQCLWLMLYRVGPRMRPLTRNVGIVFGLLCLVYIIRIGHVLIVTNYRTDFMQSGIFDALMVAFIQLLFILLTVGLVLMFNQRLLTDIMAQEEKFSRAFHSSPYAIIINRASDEKVLDVNESFLNISGYSITEVQGKKIADLHLWAREEEHALAGKEILQNSTLRNREFLFRKKSGEIITGLFSADIITISEEICVLSSINDITDRLKAERARAANENLLNKVFNLLPVGLWFADGQGKLLRGNPAGIKIWGAEHHVSMEEYGVFKARRYPSGKEIAPDDWALAHTIRERVTVIDELLEIDAFDGSKKIILNYTTPVLDEGGRMMGAVVVNQDITAQKRAEEEIARLNEQLEQKVAEQTGELRNSQLALLNLVDDLNATTRDINQVNQTLTATNKELEAFSYSVSHDLRAPLRGIDGFSQALLEDCQDKLDATGKNYLERIRTGTQRMGLLIDDMLKLSRITRTEFKRESVDLSAMVQDILLTVRQNNPARDVQANIQKDIIMEGDRYLLEIALTNLLENAWKFTGKTENARIEFGTELTDGKSVMFIRDNGVGFDMAYVDKLFGAFQRLHSTAEFPGTGIGLATVQRIIHRHGGQIWAAGEIGRGAVFFFTLPA
jgi:PAS domain S-box-containing protein